MINEWYEYAISLKKRAINGIDGIYNFKKSLGFVGYLILIFLSLPLLKHNIWYWLILAIVYSLSLFCNSKENDNYAKMLFDIGITLAVMGLESLSVAFMVGGDIKYIIFFTILSIASYELVVFAKVKCKRFSYPIKNDKKRGVLLYAPGPLFILALTNLSGHSLRRYGTPLIIYLVFSSISILIFTISTAFFQKYIIYKCIKNNDNS